MSTIEQLVVAVLVPGFVVEVEPEREVVRVRPVGELDLSTGPELRDHVAELVAVGFEHLVIDLRGLSFIDATGVSLLLSLAAQARRERWRLSLIRGRPAGAAHLRAHRHPPTTAVSPPGPRVTVERGTQSS
jgi:anti-sigma B factor antagonist